MKFIFQLSGEHPTLPLAELKAVLDGEFLGNEIRTDGRLAFVDVDEEGTDFVSRLAYTLSASEEVASAKSVDGLAADVYDAISEAAHIPVRIADDPLTCVVRGSGLLLDDKLLLSTIALPSARAN